MLGKGVAVMPTEGLVCSPVNGTVSHVFDTRHAISITSDEGVELLIHIGLDTVWLKGEYYTALTEPGCKVKAGGGLIAFDLEKIKGKGYDTITPIVVCNWEDYKNFTTYVDVDAAVGDTLITLN
jgi:PTS system beta-glucosides-specific IIC component